MRVTADKSAIIHFRRKSCLPCDSQFSIVGEAIPVVTKCKCLASDVIDQFLDLNWWLTGLRLVEGPLVPCSGGSVGSWDAV